MKKFPLRLSRFLVLVGLGIGGQDKLLGYRPYELALGLGAGTQFRVQPRALGCSVPTFCMWGLTVQPGTFLKASRKQNWSLLS